MGFEFWGPIFILDDKTQFPESHEIFGYYSGPSTDKDDLDWSWFSTKEHGPPARSVLRHYDRPTYTNRRMVPVSGETNK